MKSELLQIIEDDCHLATENFICSLSPLKNTYLLVTGGSGFIGIWIAELITFLNKHHQFNTSLILLSRRANSLALAAPHLTTQKHVTLIEKDILMAVDTPSEVNWIIHAAGTPDNRIHASEPLRTMNTIINGTDTILSSCTRLPNLQKFLNISSGLVYGAQPWEMNSIQESFRGVAEFSSINSAYIESKRVAETICAVYRNQHRLPITNARPFAFIGPYQLLDRPWAINNFMRDALLGENIRILGDGNTVRSYMYPSDMSVWLLICLLHGTVGASYNIGNPVGTSLYQLAEKIADNFHPRPKIVSRLVEDNGINISKLIPDTTLAQTSFSLKLTVDLDIAIKRTILWNQLANE